MDHDQTEALRFIAQISSEFKDDPSKFHSFVDVITRYRNGEIVQMFDLMSSVEIIFRGKNHLIEAFNLFLPNGYTIIEMEEDVDEANEEDHEDNGGVRNTAAAATTTRDIKYQYPRSTATAVLSEDM